MREILQQALKDICGAKLCEINSMSSRHEMIRLMDKAIAALEAELAKPEQEPEHWSDCAIYNEPAYPKGKCDCGGYYKPIAYKEKNSDSIFYDKNNCNGEYISLYTSPPRKEWVGLTDEDLEDTFGFIDELLRDHAYRTEAKLRSKNYVG